MFHRRVIGASTAGLLLLAACGGSESDGNGTGGPATLRGQLQTAVNATPAFIDAFTRIETAVRTGSAPDVTLTGDPARPTARVLVDMNNDQTRETEVLCRITFNDGSSFAEGARISASGPPGSFESASGTVTLQEGTVQVAVSSGGFLDVASGDELILFNGNLTTAGGNLITGQIGFEILSEGTRPVFGTMFFEDNGQGGSQIRAVADDGSFDFIVR